MKQIFSKEARANIEATGNVWGTTLEYWINRTFKLGRASLRVEWRRSSNFMGRFGGGWNFKVGAQWSSWRHIIFNLFVMTVTFTCKKKES